MNNDSAYKLFNNIDSGKHLQLNLYDLQEILKQWDWLEYLPSCC